LIRTGWCAQSETLPSRVQVVLLFIQVLAFKQKVKFPESGWGSQLEKMPLFTKAEMNKYIEYSGKRLGSSHHSVPTSWK